MPEPAINFTALGVDPTRLERGLQLHASRTCDRGALEEDATSHLARERVPDFVLHSSSFFLTGLALRGAHASQLAQRLPMK